MSVVDGVRTVLGMSAGTMYHCWECDANYRTMEASDECVYCGSTDIRVL